MRAWLIAVLAWIVSVAILAPVCFFAVIFLAGPHSSLLPGFLPSVVLILGWSILLVAPVWIARATWRRAARR